MKESELIARAKLGDKAALGIIVDTYYNDIYKFLSRRHGDSYVAQDITQDTFLKFTQSLSGYTEKNKLRSYLFAIAISCSNDYFRRQRIDKPLEDYEQSEDDSDIEYEFEKNDKRQMVKGAVLSLPDWQRDVVILRYYHDMKLKEIAVILDIPVSTAKTRLHRASKTLEVALKGEWQ